MFNHVPKGRKIVEEDANMSDLSQIRLLNYSYITTARKCTYQRAVEMAGMAQSSDKLCIKLSVLQVSFEDALAERKFNDNFDNFISYFERKS